MAWTAPRTWTTNEVVSKAIMDAHVRDNLLETAPAKVTTAGDIVYADGANSLVRLPVGNPGDRLRVNTAGTALVWDAVILDRDLTQQEIVSESGLSGIWSHSVGANELGATGGVRLTMYGDYLNDTGIDRWLRFLVGFGASSPFDSGNTVFPASANRRKWRLVVEMMNSAAGAQKWGSELKMSRPDTLSLAQTDAANPVGGDSAGYNASSEDTTGALTLKLEVQHSVANASLSLRKEIAILEKLPAA